MKFFRSKDNSTDCRTQVTESRAQHEITKRAVEAALAKFDEAPDDDTILALRRAREQEAVAGEVASRAERVLASALEREKNEADAEARSELARLEKEVDGARRLRAAQLAEAEAKAFIAVSDARFERLKHNLGTSDARSRIDALKRQLGAAVGSPTSYVWDVQPGAHPVKELLRAAAARLPEDDVRRQWLHDMIR